MNKKNRNINKDAKFATVSKSQRLYGLDPIWKVTLKVGATGFVMSFFLGLFTFVDQLMLVNFMPNTERFSFNTLFYSDPNTSIFTPLLNHINNNGGSNIIDTIKSQIGTDKQGLLSLITAISNVSGLTVFNSPEIVRSAVSLIGTLSIILNSIPSLFAVGTSVKYTQALGKGNRKLAAHIWQNAFIGCILTGLICFVLLLILIPTIVPIQAVTDTLTTRDFNGLFHVALANFKEHGWTLSNVVNNHGVVTIYYTNNNHHFTYFAKVNNNQYLDLSKYQITSSTLSNNILTTIAPNGSFNIDLVGKHNANILSVWNKYYQSVRLYSIRWAENFLYIMNAGTTIFALANLLAIIMRSDGAIIMSTTITITTVVFNIILDFIFIKIAQIGMEGAACASVIGWIIQVIWSGCFLQFSKKINSCANFVVLNKKYLSISWRTMGTLALYGLGMLIGTSIFSVSNIILVNQVSYITVKIIPQIGSEYYLSVMGAVTPIINLFFFTIFGLVRSNSAIFSYNYSAKRIDRVRQAFWWNIGIMLVAGLIILGIIGFCNPIKDGILSWFKITKNSPDYQLQTASKLIWLWLIQIPLLAFTTGGMLTYRSTNRLGTSYFVAILRSGLFNIPIIFIFMTIAINCKDSLNAGLTHEQINLPYENKAMWFFFYNVPVGRTFSSLTIFIMSVIFIYKYLPRNPRRKTYEIWPISIIAKRHFKNLFNESLPKNIDLINNNIIWTPNVKLNIKKIIIK